MKTYKAISLKQPWADMVVKGKKTIETRKWNTRYRNDLVICSSAKPIGIGIAGCALGIVEVYDTRPMEKKDEKRLVLKSIPKHIAGCCGIFVGLRNQSLSKASSVSLLCRFHNSPRDE